MKKELKVLMLGGPRTGKSSALAAIMEAFISGPASSFLTIKDKTELSKQEGVKQKSIASRLKEVRNSLATNAGKIVLVNSDKTELIWHYKLKLCVPGRTDDLYITFTDVNGEFYSGMDPRQETVKKMVPEYDIFIVAIDTTFLMEAINPESELVNCTINEKYNCQRPIHSFLTEINDHDGLDAKLVIFAPIKCEYWAKKNRLDEVSQRVMEFYELSLKHLTQCKSVQLEVIPIQTLGSVIFEEHREPFIFSWKESFLFFFDKSKQARCSLLDDGMLRLADGSIKDPATGTMQPDINAFLIADNPDFIRPNSWFKFLSAEYSPHNCEQLAYHILEFMLDKAIDAKIRADENQNCVVKFFQKLAGSILNLSTLGLWDMLVGIFGSITIDEMKGIIRKFHKNSLIKYDVEGIKTIKSCNFKTK